MLISVNNPMVIGVGKFMHHS